MESYDNVYLLYEEDECGDEYVRGVFSNFEKAQSFADTHIKGWYIISERTLDVG